MKKKPTWMRPALDARRFANPNAAVKAAAALLADAAREIADLAANHFGADPQGADWGDACSAIAFATDVVAALSTQMGGE